MDSHIFNGPKSLAPEPSTLVMVVSGLAWMTISTFRKTYWMTKRTVDVMLSILGIILLSPLFLLAIVLIKCTSKGSVIYKQTRVGKYAQFFEIYKFRTMKIDAEKSTGPVWAKKNDKRLIPVGQFLRKTHLDELPQFFNVLKGEMSLVGPRPERPVFVEKFLTVIPDYEKRLTVRPGITGLAQVRHRYDETLADVRKKVKYDVLYIKNYCLWTDLRIFLRTFRIVLTGQGAH